MSLTDFINEQMMPRHKEGLKFPKDYPSDILYKFIRKVEYEMQWTYDFYNLSTPMRDMYIAEKELKKRDLT